MSASITQKSLCHCSAPDAFEVYDDYFYVIGNEYWVYTCILEKATSEHSREKYCDEKLKKFSNAFHLTKKSHFPQNDDEEENIIN